MEPLLNNQEPVIKSKHYIFFSSWILYFFQIIIILSFTLGDIDYYSKCVLLGDLILFLITCGNSIFVTYSLYRNIFKFYQVAFFLTISYDILVVICLFFIGKKVNNNFEKRDIILIIIKLVEILPGLIIFINYKEMKKTIKRNNQNHNHNNNHNNNHNENNIYNIINNNIDNNNNEIDNNNNRILNQNILDPVQIN